MASISSPQTERLSVAVIGLGAIGGVAAGCLVATSRHDVIACVRAPIERLTLDAPDGTVELPLKTLTDPAQAKPADWVLLCTKTHATASAAPWLKRLCTPATRVAVLQNGIDHVARVTPLAGGATVLPVIVYYNGERLAADRVRLRRGADQDFVVADNDAGRAFAQLFEGTPLRVHLGDDFVTLAWRKLLINAVASPVTALTLQRQAVLRRPDIQTLCLAVLEEAIAVGRAEGAQLVADEAGAHAGNAVYLFRRARHLDVSRPPRRPPARARSADRRDRRSRRAPRHRYSAQPRALGAVAGDK